VIDGGGMLGAPLLFAIEVAILYAAGTYVMGHLIGLSGFGGGGSALGRMAFYLLVFPGVVLHEGAHYLACVLTGTRVTRFAPFSPGRSDDGRLLLGYVRHERRVFPVGAIIGLAPILLNHASHTSRGNQTLCRGCGRGFLREWLPDRYPTAGHSLGVPISKLRVGKRTQPRRPVEPAAAASGLRSRDPLDQSSKNRLRESSLPNYLRSVRASGWTLRPASPSSHCRCPHDGTCRTGDTLMKPH
jgi:hypothetical protein